MCIGGKSSSSVALDPLPPARALARTPTYPKYPSMTQTMRSTVVNPDGIIKAAPIAHLGGSRVILGG